MSETEIIEAEVMPTESTALQQAGEITPLTMLNMAVQQGASIESMRELMQLKREWEADEARKAYVSAMNQFKADPPEIFKDKNVSFDTSAGKTEYNHASLANVTQSIGQSLAKHGLSHRWDVDQIEGGQIKVTCVITHEQGHSERVPLQSGPDQSGKKNNIQAVGSTVSYLQRYTLLSATGLATKEMDDDGAGYEPVEYITESQQADLKSLLEEVGADYGLFCKYMGVTALSDIPAAQLQKATAALEAKRK